MVRLSRAQGFIRWIILAVLLSLALLVLNAYRLPSLQRSVAGAPLTLSGTVDMVPLLSEALQIRTISGEPLPSADRAEFDRWLTFLAQRFPQVHKHLQVEPVNHYGLLYTWKGSDPALAPVLFTAHYDVVSVDDAHWQYAPFAGTVAEDHVWGRGAMDDKLAVIGLLAATTELLAQGYQPQRTLILAFGHDEEVGGIRGAAQLTALLKQRGVKPLFIVDEGMPITHGVLGGLSQPAALIGIAEKGFVNIELSADSPGGHSSTPAANTAVGIVSRAIARIEENPMPARIDGAAGAMFDALAPEMPWVRRVLLGNRWLTAPLLKRQLAKSPTTNAMIRTTAAATIFEGSPQANVLPTRARAVVNFRLLPGDTPESVVQHVSHVIADPRVQVRVLGEATRASNVSSVDSEGFKLLARTVREAFPDVLVAPALLVATTDTKYYGQLSEHVYRFRPIRVTPDDIKRFHGANERISVSNVQEALGFYVRLIENSSAGSVADPAPTAPAKTAS